MYMSHTFLYQWHLCLPLSYGCFVGNNKWIFQGTMHFCTQRHPITMICAKQYHHEKIILIVTPLLRPECLSILPENNNHIKLEVNNSREETLKNLFNSFVHFRFDFYNLIKKSHKGHMTCLEDTDTSRRRYKVGHIRVSVLPWHVTLLPWVLHIRHV